MNIKLIARYIGLALLFNSVFMFISALVSMINGFDSSFYPLIISSLITLIVGTFPLIFVRRSEDINLKEGFTITIFSWILCCIFGMLPYLLWGGSFSLINAWFESVSGYTTTGSTILSNVESLPKGLIFWRSSTHFIGGIGVVIFMLLVLPAMSTFRMKMSRMEISSLSKEHYKFKTKETLKVISTVYIGITLLTLISLMFVGMNFFDAINHAFSIVSTGGFSTKNQSILYFNSFKIEFVCGVFMLISGLHFGLLYSSLVSRSFKIFKSPIIRYFLIFIFVSSIVIALNIKLSGNVSTWEMAFRQAFFQVISISTTTGLATTDTSVWPVLSTLLIMFLSIQAACSGSTSGGIKVDRVWIFFKSVKKQIVKQIHPSAVVPIKVGNHTIEPEVASAVSLHIVLYLFIIFVVSLALAALGLDTSDSLSSSISSMGNVGPGLGSCGSLGNFNHFPILAKLILSLEMLLGRLEIYTFLMVFVIFKRS